MDIPGISPYLFRIDGFGIRWYGFFMAVAMAVGIVFLVRAGRRRQVSEDFLYNAALVTIVAGVIGARLVYVFTNPGFFLQYPAEIIRIDHGGLSIHGALGGGSLGLWWYARRYRAPATALLDWLVPGVTIGIIFVRIGNIFNQEILGHAATILGGARHPSQIYGSIFGVLLLALYIYQSRRETPDGYRFWSFVVAYSVLRGFVGETFRDNPLYVVHYVNHYWGVGFMTLTQWFTIPILVVAILVLMRMKRLDRHWAPQPGDPAYAITEESAGYAEAEAVAGDTGSHAAAPGQPSSADAAADNVGESPSGEPSSAASAREPGEASAEPRP